MKNRIYILYKSIIHYIKDIFSMYFLQKKLSENNLRNKAIIFLSPDYNNLGDVAISYAQENFIRKYSSVDDVVEIPLKMSLKYLLDIRKKIDDTTIITIIGGGNIGDKYELIERYRRIIIKKLKNYKIISFPQTIDFSNTEYSNYLLKKSIKDYGKNKNLVIIAREEISYKIFNENFKNKVIMTPDIVLSLNIISHATRKGILLLFRDDKERIMSKKIENKIYNTLDSIKCNYSKKDTSIKNFLYQERYNQLNELLSEISKSKLIITDRLHGMIFSYITHTPCIVFENSNHKIKKTFENWLCDCNYIKLFDNSNIGEIKETILLFLSMNEEQKKYINFDKKYNMIKNLIKM